MPIYYGAQALKKVMVDGLTINSVILEWLALIVISLLFTLLNTFFLKISGIIKTSPKNLVLGGVLFYFSVLFGNCLGFG